MPKGFGKGSTPTKHHKLGGDSRTAKGPARQHGSGKKGAAPTVDKQSFSTSGKKKGGR